MTTRTAGSGTPDTTRTSTGTNKTTNKSNDRAIKSRSNNTKNDSNNVTASAATAAPATTTTKQTNENNSILMDSPELDHRMLRKAEAILQWRTTRLVLVIERCTNDHNYSAILRTAEALGIQKVYMIDPPPVDVNVDDDDNETDTTKVTTNNSKNSNNPTIKRTAEEERVRREHHLFAQNATEWLTVYDYQTSELCVQDLVDRDGYQLWVTDLSQKAECLTHDNESLMKELLSTSTSTKTTTTSNNDMDGGSIQQHSDNNNDYDDGDDGQEGGRIKIALVMGTEAVGCSQYMLNVAHRRIYLPLRGWADSLNLSVATALIIQQMFILDPSLVGSGMSNDEKQELRKVWYMKLCSQRILTSKEKKLRQKLQVHIRKCYDIQEKKRDRQKDDKGYKLQDAEQAKLDTLPQYEEQLRKLEEKISPASIERAIRPWLDDPIQPLSDVRRADIHRVCYVGKNTKQLHSDHWKDMAATMNLQTTKNITANTFRQQVLGNKE